MLTVRHLTLFLNQTPLFGPLTFDVAKGDIVTLMGPSGCGKSSLLAWMVGALTSPLHASGELWRDEQRLDMLPTAQRQTGILFQDALLFDHFTVGQNLLLALSASLKGAARQDAIHHALERAGMAGFSSRDPATLSGGQRARVALLRADDGSHVIDTDLSALGKLLTILGGMKAGEALVGADYRTRPDFWKGFDDA